MVLLLILLTPLLLGTVLWVLGYILIRILTLPETQRVCDDISSKCKTPLQTIAFFHPYCNAGGGGERVLWSAVQAIQRTYSNYHVVIYSGDVDATADAMLAKADASFGFAVDPARVTIAFLKTREYVEDKYYPRFTMLMQSMGSLVLTWEALRVHRPTILVDSMGYAFALPLFAMLAGSKVAAYVHYPTISTDMLRKVAEGQGDFNNDGTVARSTTLTTLKLVYYRLFAQLYGLAGWFSSVTMVNSSWTRGHIQRLWWGHAKGKATLVYPPCDTTTLEKLPLPGREAIVVSVAQFRQEKDHRLQVATMAQLFESYPQYKGKVKLVMIGGCRNAGDEQRVADLKSYTSELGLTLGVDVEIHVNVNYDELQAWLGKAMIGIHTMRDEHFGIGVVEFLAAGPVCLAHNSAGPKMDIVVPVEGKATGYLASSKEEYAGAIHSILSLGESERIALQTRARASVSVRFSEQAFQAHFLKALEPLLQ